MNDAEITRLCAEAMPSWKLRAKRFGLIIDPLNSHAQAMELVETFRLDVSACEYSNNDPAGWIVFGEGVEAEDEDLRRAICLCVIKWYKGSL